VPDGGATDGGVSTVSCDATTFEGRHVCTEFSTSGWDSSHFSAEQAACARMQGTYAESACPTGNRSGTCTFISSGSAEYAGIPAGTTVKYVWYSLSAADAWAAQVSCVEVLGGTWTAEGDGGWSGGLDGGGVADGGMDGGVADAGVADGGADCFQGSCNMPAAYTCTDFGGLLPDALEATMTACAQGGGTWSESPCS
jgi:hypothetical protein